MVRTEQAQRSVWWRGGGVGDRLCGEKVETQHNAANRAQIASNPSETDREALLDLPSKVLFSYPSINHIIQHLHLDLFTPVSFEEGAKDNTITIEDLSPLTNLRGLRSLKLVGMLDSYQRVYWQVAWLCPYLKELTLEMALEPVLRRGLSEEWQVIKEGWQMERPGMATSYR